MTDEIRYATGLIINASIVACHFNSKLIWNNFAKTTPSMYTYQLKICIVSI